MSVSFSHNAKFVISILYLFLVTASFLFTQDEELFTRRLIWRGDENVYRYSVEIQKLENRIYSSLMQEFTTASFLVVSLPAGDYRFRIIPHDILDRPAQATQWARFSIRPAKAASSRNRRDTSGRSEQTEVISFEQISEDDNQSAGSNEEVNTSRFNTLGISAGTSFADPLITASIHGTYSPFKIKRVENLFFELGCDAGFISTYDDVENFYCIYPYLNIGYFIPFNSIGFFASAGGGYLFGSYQFSHGGDSSLGMFAANITAGVNIINTINISYTLKTNFSDISHQVAVGYVYRFLGRR